MVGGLGYGASMAGQLLLCRVRETRRQLVCTEYKGYNVKLSARQLIPLNIVTGRRTDLRDRTFKRHRGHHHSRGRVTGRNVGRVGRAPGKRAVVGCEYRSGERSRIARVRINHESHLQITHAVKPERVDGGTTIHTVRRRSGLPAIK